MSELRVEVRHAPEGAVVILDGELDKITTPLLREPLAALLAEGVVEVVIDAERLAFCDSSGLWALIEHQRRLKERGGSLRLTGVHGMLRRVLEITGLSAAFPTYS